MNFSISAVLLIGGLSQVHSQGGYYGWPSETEYPPKTPQPIPPLPPLPPTRPPKIPTTTPTKFQLGTYQPTIAPTIAPTITPSSAPSFDPSTSPSSNPSAAPSSSTAPSVAPTISPTPTPTTAPVDLGIACNFTILTKSGVTTTGVTSVIGNMGTSPAAVTAITGFAMTLAGDHSTSSLVTAGTIYAANHAVPTPAMMTTAISDMEAAYVDAAGRAGPGPVTVGLGTAGDISGLVLEPGIYKWSTTVKVDTDLTFNGTSTDIWILQIAGTFTVGPDVTILLSGGAKAEHIYWAIAGVVAFDDRSHGEGIFLAQTMISFNAGSSLHGAALAQTAVTMIATEISGVACNMSSSFVPQDKNISAQWAGTKDVVGVGGVSSSSESSEDSTVVIGV